MSSNNPTGMSNATAIRFRKMARDIQMYNKSNHSNNYDYHHQSNTTIHAKQPTPSFSIESFIHNLFR
jgi:hypothetical protein